MSLLKLFNRGYRNLGTIREAIEEEAAERGVLTWGAGEDLRQVRLATQVLQDLEGNRITAKKAVNKSWEGMWNSDTGLAQDAWSEVHSCAVEIGKIAAAARERKQKEREEAARKASRTCLGDLMPAL